MTEAINFQGVARNKLSQVLNNDSIALRFLIRDSTATGPIVYDEVRNTTTDSFGVFNVEIGAPEAVIQSGNIKELVNWNNGKDKFLQVLMDTHEDKKGFLDMGTTQLISVPYSFYSDVSAGSGTYFFSATIPFGVVQGSNNVNLGYTVKFQHILFNEGNAYDSTSSIFTAPEDGIYEFTVGIIPPHFKYQGQFVNYEGEAYIWTLTKNDTICKVLGYGDYDDDEDPEPSFHTQVRLKLEKGGTVKVKLFGSGGNDALSLRAFNYYENDEDGGDVENLNMPPAAFTEFSGYKIK